MRLIEWRCMQQFIYVYQSEDNKEKEIEENKHPFMPYLLGAVPSLQGKQLALLCEMDGSFLLPFSMYYISSQSVQAKCD